MSNVISSEFIPPMLNGVSASKVFLPALSAHQTITLFEYLTEKFSHILPEEWEQRFLDGLIYSANGQQLTLNSLYQPNTHIFYYRFLANEIHVPFEHQILFENEHIMVVDKPHFLTISPTGQYVQETLLVRLKNQTGLEHLAPAHRLDRETAGVVLFTKQPDIRPIYQNLFATRSVHKIYHAIAAYRPELNFPQTLRLCLEKSEPFYTMQVNPDGQINSETYIKCLAHHEQLVKYELHPLTGKQHQLRVHLNSLGIPILNDSFYPEIKHKKPDDFSAPLQLLAKEIQFSDPITQQPIHIKSKFDLDWSYQCNDN